MSIKKIYIKLLFPIYILLIIFGSDIYSGYAAKKRIQATNTEIKEIRIAIIDTSFDISVFDINNIENPLNVQDNTNALIRLPRFDYSGSLEFSDHGTSIMNLFIGKYGLLKNAVIIPIQLTSSDNLPRALEYAVNQGANIITISLSFGKSYNSFPFLSKIAMLEASKNVPILIAAGNDGVCLEKTIYGQSLILLAKQSNQRIWIVGATKLKIIDEHIKLLQETITNFSNYPISIDGKSVFLWAPGQNIVLGPLWKQIFATGVSGTSIATPMAAIQAIFYSHHRNISIEQALIELNKIQQK
jgi:hypothetical protein